jgi:hypothetical protein
MNTIEIKVAFVDFRERIGWWGKSELGGGTVGIG